MHWLGGMAFQELKRTVYFWGLCFGVVGLMFVWLLNPADPYVRYINPALALVFIYWCVQLRLSAPLERIEQQVAVGLTVVFSGKFLFYLFAPDLRASWLEVEDAFWNLAFQMVIFYMVFDARRGVWMAMGVTAFTLAAGLFRFVPEAVAGQPNELFQAFIRAEIRLLCMGLLLYVMARIKDRLILVSRQMEHSEMLARTDALTGLANRMAISETLEVEILKPEGLYAVLLDIDHFKRINDQFGHAVGDQVLQETARRLRAKLRKGDSLGRWGGEDFLLLMRADQVLGVVHAVERLREAVAALPFEGVGTVTASFGIGQASIDNTSRSLLHRADTALYRAKNSGRNRVEVDTQPAVPAG
ncbi:MAG: GGDEF domain-containing protein [Meiothermus sp.]|nr:GGDEF domain-containing protein [Meiothermus sp.]